jgi:hypothetical protein
MLQFFKPCCFGMLTKPAALQFKGVLLFSEIPVSEERSQGRGSPWRGDGILVSRTMTIGDEHYWGVSQFGDSSAQGD